MRAGVSADTGTDRPSLARKCRRSLHLWRNGHHISGDYTAVGEYGGQPSHITVSLTLADNVITAVDVVPHATNPTSLDLQERFADAIGPLVIGRPITELEVSKTAGSSNTPAGFNDALDQIRTQAAI